MEAKPQVDPSKRSIYFLIAVLAVIWGSSFILMKRGLLVYTPFQIGALRIFVSAIALLPFIIRHFPKVEKRNWRFLLATGMFGNGIPSVLFPLAETRISSGVAGMINSLTPFFTLLVGMIWVGMRASRMRIIGLLIGLGGAILLVLGNGDPTSLAGDNSYAMLIVLATICYAISVNILRYKITNLDPIRTTGFALFFVGIPMGLFLFSGDFVDRTLHEDGAWFSFSCIVILGLLSTALSTVLFNKLIKIAGALSASSVTYLIPIVATLWGIADGETVGVFHIFGLSAIMGGVYLVNRGR